MSRTKKSKKTATKITDNVEARIVELCLQHPEYGARRLVPLLEQEGITVTTSAVYATLKRNNLQNRTLRLLKLEEQRTVEQPRSPVDTAPPPAEESAPLPARTDEKTSEPRVPSAIKSASKPRGRRPWSLTVPNLLLLGLIGYFWVSAIGNLLNASRQPLPVALPPAVDFAPELKADVRPLEDYSIIIERNLFGSVAAEIPAPEQDVSLEGLPVSLKVLGLKLVGTVVGEDAALNLAIIDNQSTRKQELYHEGDEVGQTLLKKILRNKVVLSTDKGDEILTMEFEDAGKGAIASQRQTAGKMPTAEASDNAQERDGLNSPLANLDEFMQKVQISPYLQGDQPAGATITGTRSVLARLRLRSGDVITGANGAAITSPEQAREVFEKLAQGEKFTLDILRKNRPRKIRIR